MSVFDRLRPKWKHADPAVRAAAVRELTAQDVLATIAEEDPSDDVRRAAVDRLSDQDALIGIALGKTSLASVAVDRLTTPSALARVALNAPEADVRLRAVERIDDAATLQRVAGFDPDASVRARARAKTSGADHAKRIIREVLARLCVAETKMADQPEFSGTLDQVCQALIQDPRFTINAGVMEEEEATSGAAAVDAAAPRALARFLGQTRTAGAGPTPAIRFYQIKVWRTRSDAFGGLAEEKNLAVTNNAVAWSKASSGTPETRPMANLVPPID